VEERDHRRAIRPRISRRDLKQRSKDVEKELQLQMGIQVFLRLVSYWDGDSFESYERNAVEIRAAFSALEYSLPEALNFVAAQITTIGVKLTQRRQIALVKALLPDEYPSEVEEAFHQAEVRNLVPFSRAETNVPVAFVELDEEDPDRRDPYIIASLAREADHYFSCWEDLIEVQGGCPMCGSLEEICDLGLEGFAGMMFGLGDNPYTSLQEQLGWCDEEEEDEEED
jgi:hypothetical protein